MKLNVTFFMLLSAVTLTISYCPKKASALIFDKSNLEYHQHNQPTNRRITNAVTVTGRDLEQEPQRRKARCLELFDWIYDYFEPEFTTSTTTTATTTTTLSTTTKAVTKQSAETKPVTTTVAPSDSAMESIMEPQG